MAIVEALGGIEVALGLERHTAGDGHNIVLGSGAIALGAAWHFLGLAAGTAGDVDDAITQLEGTVRMNDAMGAGPAAARSRLELARTLLEVGDRARSQRVANDALDVARSLGMAQIAEELSGLLDRESRG